MFSFRFFLTLVLLLFCANAGRAANYTATANGSWTNSATWSPAGIPGIADLADVAATSLVTNDVNNSAACDTFNLEGTLVNNGTFLNNNNMNNAGAMKMGTNSVWLVKGNPQATVVGFDATNNVPNTIVFTNCTNPFIPAGLVYYNLTMAYTAGAPFIPNSLKVKNTLTMANTTTWFFQGTTAYCSANNFVMSGTNNSIDLSGGDFFVTNSLVLGTAGTTNGGSILDGSTTGSNNATNVTLHPASSIQMNGTWNIGGAFTNNGVLRMSGTVNGSSPTNGPQGTIGMDTSITKAVALAGFGVNGVGSLTNSAGQTASGAIYLVGDSSIGGNNASTLVLSGVVSGSKRFIKVGTGTVNLSPALNTTPETYTGDTVINGGTLIVTHAGAGMTNPINSAGSLVFGGGNGYCGSGTFQMNTPGTAAVFTQTVAGVSVLLGGNTITTSLGAGSSNQLFMNAISRASGGGTLDFNQAGGVISIYRTTTTTNAIGHYGGALTWAGTDWLTTTNASSPYGVKPYAAYATGGSSSPAVWTVNSNLTFAANPSANLGTAVSVGSLRFTAATTITWGSSGTMSVGTNGTGGILVQNGITANLDASGSGSRFLQAQNGGGELVFAIFGTGILNISSGSSAVVIQDNGGATAVTKSGAGYLLLKAQETYTGKTMIHQGTVAMVGTPTNTPAIYVGLGATLGLASGTANSTTFGTNAATPCSISGSGTITNGVILGTNVTVYPGGTNLYGTLSFNNGLTMSSNVGATVVTMDLDTISGQGDLINVTGAFNPGGARLVVNPGTNFGVGRYLLVTGSITPAGSFQTSITFSSGAGTAVVVTNGNNLLLDVTSFAYCTPATPFGMTGGTNCSTAATSIGLNNSQTGYTYQLFTNGVSVGTTGSTNPVAAGAFTFPTTFNTPATYTMWGTNNAGGCAAQMTNNVVITTAPVGGTVAALASAVCNGNGTFLTNYNSSGTIIWQSRTGSNPFADVAGAPNTVSLSTGNLTTTTDFRARLTNSACSDSLSTTSTVTVATAPATFTVTGGTNCASNGGVTVGLSGSVNGVTYQLFTNAISTGTTGSQAGTGAALNFGAKTTVANYTIWGTNGTGCSALMSGGAAVYNLTATVSGGGAIRRGQTATITNTLSGRAPFNVTWSDGVTSNGVSSPLLRTVSPTAATTYTITNLTDANCSTNGGFTGSAAFTVGTAYKILTSAIAVAAGTSTNITVTLVDSAGATISGFNGAVNFTFSGLSASAYGSNATVSGVNLGSTTAVTLTSGVSTNLPLKAYHYSPSTQTLVVQDDASPTANASTNTGGAGASVTVTSGAVSSLAWLTQPGGAVYGSAFGTKPILATVDQFGVPSTTGLPATLNVAVRLASGTGTLLGTTNYNMGTTGSNGVVTFQDLQINSTGSKTLAMDMRPVTNSAVWLDGSDTNTIVGSSPVTGWLDKSGNGVSFTNTIGSVGTITYANTLNGRKVVTFPGNSPNSSTGGKGLTNGNYTFTGNSTHMFVVVRHTAGGYATGQNWLGPISSANGTNADWNVTTSWSIDCNNNANGQARTQRNSAGFGTGVDLPADGTTFLIEAGHDFAGNVQAIGVKATNQNNYATFAPGFAGAFNLTKLSVGCRFDPNATGGGFWNGDIGEVIIYHTYLSAADRGSVEFYATNKWINPSFATPNTAAFTVAAATPTQLVFSNAPSTTPAGATMTSVTVQMLDAAGQPVSSAGTNITVALTSGSGTLLGTLTQATAANGQATFNNLSMTNSGAKQLQASAAGLTSTPNASFTINPAAANKLVFVQGPSAVLSGAAISPAMTVQLQDQYGNNRSDAGTNVTITVASGTITLSGTTTIASDSTGLATFSNVIPNGSTQSPTLQASAAPLTAAVSGSFLVTAVNIDLLTFTTQPASTNAGQTMAEVAVTATYLGSPVTNVPITLVLTNSTGTLLGTVNRTTDVNGVAHYTDLSMTNAGVKQLRATATTNAAASATFTISALMGTKLGFMTQPASTNAGQVVAPPVAVQVQDTYGNNVSSNGVSVGLTLGGSGTLSGTTTRSTDGSGAATFNDLSVNLAGNKTLSAAASGLTGATSSSFTISNAGATKLGIVTNAPSNATAYVAFTNSPTVVLQDQFGNTASNSGVAVYVTASAGTLQGTTTNNTGADGRAVFSGLSLTNSGSVTLTFNSTGLTSTNTTAITVVALPPLSRVSNTSLTNMPVTPPVYGYTLTVFTNNAGANLSTPDIIGFASPPGETNRLFYIRKTGYVMVITNLASPNTTVFLDLTGKSLVSATGTGEGGLLGLAFHPGYASNGQFYVFYLGTDNTTSFGGGNGTHDIIARYTNSPGANTAVLASEQKLIRQYDRKDNHNGGDMHFGPDGYLYVSLGDEGFGPSNEETDYWYNSQFITNNYFSTVLRLDVDKKAGNVEPNKPHAAIVTNSSGLAYYSVPADNPFIGRTSFNGNNFSASKVRTEMYCIGLRNPWRFTFDDVSGLLYLGDVGWTHNEEIDIIQSGSNYGWSYMEGSSTLAPRNAQIPASGFTNALPIFEYVHSGTGGTYGTNTGNTVMGGVVYRGSKISQLYGYYVFGDYNYTGTQYVYAFKYDGTNITGFQRLTTESQVVAYGIDPSNGDVLLADNGSGLIRRLVYSGTFTGTAFPTNLSGTGAFTNLSTLTNSTAALTPSTGIVSYDLNVPFWSDNAQKSRWFSVPNTNLDMTFNSTNNWSFPTGTVWIKHFDMIMTNGDAASSKRLETRFIVKNSGGVYGVTYRWGGSLTNAALVPEEGLDENLVINDGGGILRTQVWHYPSRLECLACHTTVGGEALGFNTPQLNMSKDYGYGATNQIQAYSDAGYLSNSIPAVNTLLALAHATNTSATVEYRVRSYLAANCVQCHQPGGAGAQQANWDARITTALDSAGIVDGALVNSFGDSSNRVIKAGSLSNSIMYYRVATLGDDHMPPLATSLINTQAVNLLASWITNSLVIQTTTNVLISLVNPALPGQAVTFTATVTTISTGGGIPTGNVIFRTNSAGALSTNSLNGSGVATSASTTLLPHGSNVVTAEYAGEGNFTGSTNSFSQIVNTPPVLRSNHTFSGPHNSSFTMPAVKLQTTNQDADGDALTVLSVTTPSTNGGTVALAGGIITFTPTNNYIGADRFSFTITDGYTNVIGVVYVTITDSNAPTFNIVSQMLTNGSYVINFAGIPGSNYYIQATTNLSPAQWATIGTNAAGTNGLYLFADPNYTNYPSRFYRTANMP